MTFSLFLTTVFFFILFFFGWQLSRYLLKEKNIEFLIGFSGIFGISLYIFFVNALSHFITVGVVFYLVLFLFFAFGMWLFYINRQNPTEWGIDKKWRKIILGTTLILMVISGFIHFRYSPTLHGPGGLPLTATIAEGNYPPLEIWNPNNNLRYHVTLELFSASIHKTTGLSIPMANHFQVSILVGIIFLLGFCLIKKFFDDNNFKAFISSLMMIHIGGLSFLNGMKGIPVLYDLYIRHDKISSSFKFVTDSIISKFADTVIANMIMFTWTSLTFSLIVAIVYLYFHIISREKSWGAIIFCSFLLATLALAGEVFFGLLSLALFAYPFVFGFVKKDWEKTKEFFLISFYILLIATPLAFAQGGFLSSILDLVGYQVTNFIGIGSKLFHVNKVPWVEGYFESAGSPVFHSEFYVELGLLVLLLIPSLIFLLKRNFAPALFFVVFIAMSFFIPIFITYHFWAYLAEVFHYFVRMGHVWRFFNVVNLIGGLTVGLFLAHSYLSSKKIWIKRSVLFLFVVFVAQSALFYLLYLTVGYPAFTWNAAAKYYAKTDSSEWQSYDWVRKNTGIGDLFLIVEADCYYTESYTPNYRFIANTGRMAPMYVYHCSYPENDSFKKIKENCDPSAINNLKYNYLYVNQKWIEGLEKKCLANNKLELKYEHKEESEFVRIYKVIR